MTQHDPRALRNAFGTFMTGVTVVTGKTADGTPIGFTANSFTSVSLDPPLVLVCLANRSSNFDHFAAAGGFAVNVLSEEQKDISNTFARPVEDRFAAVDWRDGPHGAPVIEGVSAWFDCSMHDTVNAGDHLILIGRVEAFDTSPAPGLGYARGAYVTPALEKAALEQGVDVVLAALIRREHKVLLVEGRDGALTLPEARVGKVGVSGTLAALLERTGLSAEPGFIYSVYDDAIRGCQQITFQCAAEQGAPGMGAFTELDPAMLGRVADPAMRQMLTRFAEETRIGNFGIYYGNQDSGQVRRVSAGG
ncbi:flavin reductase [Paracoccus fistulariae]|uniref:Flavin reductase n=1 Tax=Paracoccus fistulariae TaxID=658446 RepID=A0ABY7SMI5_9RHOB|nr:flavin reductase [Paracoccus fistulariae]MDB6182570.1 flavin reductase [Paracoccus fistulariae]WCR07778.1 flavin reductase [Paracoccus fistulariae]